MTRIAGRREHGPPGMVYCRSMVPVLVLLLLIAAPAAALAQETPAPAEPAQAAPADLPPAGDLVRAIAADAEAALRRAGAPLR